MSRPSSYKKRYASEASRLCLIGATDQILAEHFRVSTQTIRNWKATHPEFLEAVNEAKEKADSQVQKSLFKRATGYKTTLTRTVSDEDGRRIKFEKITKDVAPDSRAGRLWLRNRQPEDWRDHNNALLERKSQKMQLLERQAILDKQQIEELEAALVRLRKDYQALYVSKKAEKEVIGEGLLEQIFEAVLEIKEALSLETGMPFEDVNFTLNVDQFKASLKSPLIKQDQPNEEPVAPSSELPGKLEKFGFGPSTELGDYWRHTTREAQPHAVLFTE